MTITDPLAKRQRKIFLPYINTIESTIYTIHTIHIDCIYTSEYPAVGELESALTAWKNTLYTLYTNTPLSWPRVSIQ